jgi:hypothetical protein
MSQHCVHQTDIVIANPMWVDLFPQSCVTQRFIAFNVSQVKKKDHHNQLLVDRFFPLAI